PWLSKRLCIDGLRRRATRCRRYFARAQSPIPLVELARKRLVLIGGDEIHPVGDRGPPARNHALHRSEIVVFIPTPVLRRVEAVQRVEADPVTLPVRVINQAAQAAIVRFRPGAGPRLAPLLDGPPAVVPPAAIVRGACRQQLGGQGRCFPMCELGRANSRWRLPGVRRAEEAQAAAYRHVIEEHFRLASESSVT